MRMGPRSFRNVTLVIRIFERECAKVDFCRLMMDYSNNLSFCEQVNPSLCSFSYLFLFLFLFLESVFVRYICIYLRT
jgi:hypothetical protein